MEDAYLKTVRILAEAALAQCEAITELLHSYDGPYQHSKPRWDAWDLAHHGEAHLRGVVEELRTLEEASSTI